jgi:excisionase family DNA binding protein
MVSQDSEILTVEEAASLLRIPRSSIYKLAQEGKIPAQKVGRHWRFHRVTLLRWIAGQASFDGKPSDPGEKALESLDFT